jgi:hypothetical protein
MASGCKESFRSGGGMQAISGAIKLLDELNDAAITELRECLQTQWHRADSWKLLGELSNESRKRLKR